MESELQPPTRRLTAVAWMLALLSAAASTVTFFFPTILRDTAVTIGNARGTALTVLCVAVPLLIISVRNRRSTTAFAWMLMLGAVGYLLYNSVIFTFALRFNSYFLLYDGMFGCAIWCTMLLIREVDVTKIESAFLPSIPRRSVSIYLIASAVLFYYMWLQDILPGILSNTNPSSLTAGGLAVNPVEIMDLVVTLPLCIVGGLLLLQKRPRGLLISASTLIMLTIESISVGVDQTFGHLEDPSQPLGAVPIMVVLSLVSGSLLFLLFRSNSFRVSSRESSREALV